MLTDTLIEAYTATDYVLFDRAGEVTVNIGRASPAFDRVLDAHSAATAVIVTAYNPRSIVLSEVENKARHAELVAMIERRGFDYGLGEGRDPTGHWKAEVECVVFGITLEAGLELARAFDQNAIVFIRRGGAPELAYPKLD